MGLRFAEISDAEEILEIYKPYILNTVVTFEYDIPSIEDFRKRIKDILEKYPYLVYEENGKIIGYAYASSYGIRAAFDWDAELSVYLNKEYFGRKIGTMLYDRLIEILKKQNIVNVYARIVYPYEQSVRFHKKLGFTEAAILKNTGFKHGKWLNLLYMEKRINQLKIPPDKFIPISELNKKVRS